MTKILVVVYSYTGTGRRLAQVLCAQQDWPLSEVLELRSRKKGMRGTWRCVLDSMLGRRPRVFCDGPSPERFDAVVLVAPIWVGRMAGPMRSFVATHKQALRNAALITMMGSRGAAAAVAELAHLIGHDPKLQTAFTTREVDDGSFGTRLGAFGTAVRTAMEPSPPILRSPKPVADEANLRAIIRCHYDVFASYARSFSNLCFDEGRRLRCAAPEDANALESVRPWLNRDDEMLDEGKRARLAQALRSSQALDTMYSMRNDLMTLWDHSTASSALLVMQLETWCERAERSGIRPLVDFSQRLRSYA